MIPSGFVVSCEHASHRLPRRYGDLGLPASLRRSHIAWDQGAAQVARACARRLGCRCFTASYSRLLVDLNRSAGHPRWIPRRGFGVEIPGNRSLGADERERRRRLYYEPYRKDVLEAVRRCIERRGRCVHLGVHSFVPRLAGRDRRADIGLLYDPARARERRLAAQLGERLRRRGLAVRMNFPYRGTSDGFTAECRRRFPARSYLGLEIEINQDRLGGAKERARLAGALAAALGQWS
jgi:predicted N-formylglutamate amidohydrolase